MHKRRASASECQRNGRHAVRVESVQVQRPSSSFSSSSMVVVVRRKEEVVGEPRRRGGFGTKKCGIGHVLMTKPVPSSWQILGPLMLPVRAYHGSGICPGSALAPISTDALVPRVPAVALSRPSFVSVLHLVFPIRHRLTTETPTNMHLEVLSHSREISRPC